jgi:hypothetical protein
LQTASAELESELGGAELMDPGHVIQTAGEISRSLPPDLKQEILRRAKLMWMIRGAHTARFMVMVQALWGRDPAGWTQAMMRNRGATAQQLAAQAGPMAGLQARRTPSSRGFSNAQVRQFHRRQQARGYVPGRNRQIGIYRELEHELEVASHELESGEGFWTKVTPIPGIGNKEGHEILTRIAMRGLPLSAAERDALLLGVIRPDRGGRSYWNFPRSALDSLKAAAQPAHSLRPTPATSVAAALRLIQGRFARLYLRALRAASRTTALEWIGESMHLLQDSFSSAHVERIGGSGRIRNIRVFFIRLGWPPLSRAPHEHNAPSDDRDNVYASGALRPEAGAAARASRVLLVMALRHLRAPRSPGVRSELRAFIRRYLSM